MAQFDGVCHVLQSDKATFDFHRRRYDPAGELEHGEVKELKLIYPKFVCALVVFLISRKFNYFGVVGHSVPDTDPGRVECRKGWEWYDPHRSRRFEADPQQVALDRLATGLDLALRSLPALENKWH